MVSAINTESLPLTDDWLVLAALVSLVHLNLWVFV
jgi:hypothetical protein